MRFRTILPIVAVFVLLVAACGDDDAADGTQSTAAASNTTQPATGQTAAESSTTQPAANPGGGGGAGFITIGDETIPFDSARCYLQSQPAAAGGGSIEATAQGFGTNAAGEPVSVDFSRYSEDSQFAGDDINVTVGDPFSDSSVGFRGALDRGAVDISGSTVSASAFTMRNSDDFSEIAGAIEINC